MEGDSCSVQVALRVRPMMGSELDGRPVVKGSATNAQQLTIGGGPDPPRPFTFDFVFDSQHDQAKVYEDCVSPLVKNYIKGYNATILAYGQTGSGKTHTMGTASNVGVQPEDFGILPRVVGEIFDAIAADESSEYQVVVQFLEIHNQDINDLLCAPAPAEAIKKKKSDIQIRELNGEIRVAGVTEHTVGGREEMLEALDRGSINRTTASTNMNAVSSRSHAIFTVLLTKTSKGVGEGGEEVSEVIISKFNFVDLAGSERLKRTGAVGARREEGISINSGLLALGNCISALADPNRKGGHVPFRDSKITRLLQDALGGNSRTIMIACVSPADINEEETLNTLKYANRARNIRNKVVINRDPNLVKIERLRARVVELEQALVEVGAVVPPAGETLVAAGAVVAKPNMDAAKSEMLSKQNSIYMEELMRVTARLKEARNNHEEVAERLLRVEHNASQFQDRVNKLLEAHPDLQGQLQGEEDFTVPTDVKLVLVLQRKLGKMKAKLVEAHEINQQLQQKQQRHQQQQHSNSTSPQSKGSPDKESSASDLDTSVTSQGSEFDSMETGSEMSDDDLDLDDNMDALTAQAKVEDQQRQYDIKMLMGEDTELEEQMRVQEELLRSLQEAKDKEQEYLSKISEMEGEVEKTLSEKANVEKELEKNAKDEKRLSQLDRQNKKLRDLAGQLKELKQKLKQVEASKRDNYKSEAQVKKLQEEIENTKRQRVKLAQQIAEKTEQHREWMKAKENNMKRLAKETRTAKVELTRYKDMYKKKEAILKRENEKNAFLQRQLRDHDSKRQQARSQREKMKQALQGGGGGLQVSTEQTPGSQRKRTRKNSGLDRVDLPIASPKRHKESSKRSQLPLPPGLEASKRAGASKPTPFIAGGSSNAGRNQIATPRRVKHAWTMKTDGKGSSIPAVAQDATSTESMEEVEKLRDELTRKSSDVDKLNEMMVDIMARNCSLEDENEQLKESGDKAAVQQVSTDAVKMIKMKDEVAEMKVEDVDGEVTEGVSQVMLQEADKQQKKQLEEVEKYKTRYSKVSKKLSELAEREKAQKVELQRAVTESSLKAVQLQDKETRFQELEQKYRELENRMPTQKTIMKLVTATRLHMEGEREREDKENSRTDFNSVSSKGRSASKVPSLSNLLVDDSDDTPSEADSMDSPKIQQSIIDGLY